MLKIFTLVIGILGCFCACEEIYDVEQLSINNVSPSRHSLLVLTPGVGLRTTGNRLNTQYLRMRTGHEFPLIGILRVDGKSYRFMGGDSLRIKALAPMGYNGHGWETKYTFFYPGNAWKRPEYDDSHWEKGLLPFGSSDHFNPVNTVWGAYNLFSRRNIIMNKDSIVRRKLYVQYQCDDSLALYFDGKCILDEKYTGNPICKRISSDVINQLEGSNHVISAHGRDYGGFAYMDYGIYMEDLTYCNVDTACLKRMDVRVSQTFYVFQCGNVELRVDFTSPSLLEDSQISGVPVSFLTYQISAIDGQQHDVKILFDIDSEWLYNNVESENFVEKDWEMIRIGNRFGKLWTFDRDNRPTWSNLYLCMKTDVMTQTCREGHILLTQQLNTNTSDKGVLLLGYDEKYALQYFGENLYPYWNKEGRHSIKEVLVRIGDQCENIKKKCSRMDLEWSDKAFQHGGMEWLEKSVPFYRDFMVEHRLAISLNHDLLCFSDTVGNVRLAYNQFPFMLFYNRTDYMKALLQPIFDKCEGGDWIKKFPPCDVGSYPIVMQQASLEDYSTEIAADMLAMIVDIVNGGKEHRYVNRHKKILTIWSKYLIDKNMGIPDSISNLKFMLYVASEK